jgi:hypothetical protein
MAFLLYEFLWTGNEQGAEGTKLIAKALQSNRTLTTLNLWSTNWLYLAYDTKERNG